MSISRRRFIENSIALLAGGSISSSIFAAGFKNIGIALDPLFLKHDLKGHPENANRLHAIDNELTKRDYWKYFTPIKTRKASSEELLWCHTPEYIKELEIQTEMGGGFYNEQSQDTYLNEFSLEAAQMAAGANIELNLQVYDRKLNSGFALLRPPGHHALENKAMGFCLFNSDVIAAKALQKYRGVKKVAIIDFDVHHGNGTQDLTINDPSIMALSIHQHPFWPMTGFGGHIGEGKAKGTNVNCPFIRGAGNTTYQQTFEKVILPKLRQFQPEHIIVFAGYDGHWQDPLAGHQLSVTGYNTIVKQCMDIADELCGGRISFSLGGGYKLEPLAQCVAGTLHTMLGIKEPFIDKIGEDMEFETDFSEEIEKMAAWHLKQVPEA